MASFYSLAINNIALHIKNNPAPIGTDANENHITAFEAATILSIVFCKNKEEIVYDIVGTIEIGTYNDNEPNDLADGGMGCHFND